LSYAAMQTQRSGSLYPLIYRRAQSFVEGLLLSARALPAGQTGYGPDLQCTRGQVCVN
jgi:hypothetical protein